MLSTIILFIIYTGDFMINKTMKKFLNDLESTNDNLGSGSASAFIGSTAMSLANKAILLTQQSKEFNSYTNPRREALEEGAMKINTFRSSFDQLVNNYQKANENYSKKQDENNLGILINSSYSMALTCIEAIIAFDNLKEHLNAKYISELLVATTQLKTVYEYCMLDLKMKTTNNISDDLADFLVQKKKILSDAESIITYCERHI